MEYIELYANYAPIDEPIYARATPGPSRMVVDLEPYPKIALRDVDGAMAAIANLSGSGIVRLTGGAGRRFPGIAQRLQDAGYTVENIAGRPAKHPRNGVFFYPDLRTEFVSRRNTLGLSQSQIAPILGRSLAWIQSMEQGRIECPPYAVYALRYLSEHPEALG